MVLSSFGRYPAAGKVRRAKIVLPSNQGRTHREIAQELECNERTALEWIGRFNRHGIAVLAKNRELCREFDEAGEESGALHLLAAGTGILCMPNAHGDPRLNLHSRWDRDRLSLIQEFASKKSHSVEAATSSVSAACQKTATFREETFAEG